MAYKIRWHVEKRVIHAAFWGEMMLPQLQDWNTEHNLYMDHGAAPVHVINDIRGVTSFPSNIVTIRRALGSTLHPAMGWVIVVGGTIPMVVITQMLSQIMHFNFHAADSFEEAMRFLEEADPSIKQPLPAEGGR